MSEECIKKRNEIAKKLSVAYSKQLDKINKAIDYINSIPDSEIRTILSYKYIDGLTEDNIAELMGISDRTVRRKIRAWDTKKASA
jgi:DNA-directed RNA polymerase specialized sigma subunit